MLVGAMMRPENSAASTQRSSNLGSVRSPEPGNYEHHLSFQSLLVRVERMQQQLQKMAGSQVRLEESLDSLSVDRIHQLLYKVLTTQLRMEEMLCGIAPSHAMHVQWQQGEQQKGDLKTEISHLEQLHRDDVSSCIGLAPRHDVVILESAMETEDSGPESAGSQSMAPPADQKQNSIRSQHSMESNSKRTKGMRRTGSREISRTGSNHSRRGSKKRTLSAPMQAPVSDPLMPNIAHSSLSLPKDWPSCVEPRPCLNVLEEIAESEHFGSTLSTTHWNTGKHRRFKNPRGKFDVRQISAKNDPVHHCMLRPNSYTRFLFDGLGTIFLMYDLFLMPCILAWDLRLTDWLLHASIITMCYWILDILVSFRTGHVSVHGEVESHPWVVCMRYLRGWFALDITLVLIDAVSTAALVWINSAAASTEDEDILLMAKMCRFLRVVRMFRITRLRHVFRRIADYSPTLDLHLNIISHLFSICYVNHLMACVWYAIGAGSYTDTGYRWLDLTVGSDDTVTYEAVSTEYQYATSLHWAVTQMTPGSMQVSPQNTTERVFNVMCLLLGMVFFSHTISMLSSKMTSIKIAEQHKEEQLHTLRRFLRQNGVSHSLSVRLHREVAERMSASKKVLHINEIKVIHLISLQLQTQLRQELCGRHLLHHPLFQLCARVDELMIQNMSMNAEQVVLAPADSLFLAGTEGFAAYLNISGRCSYIQEILDDKSPPVVSLHQQQWLCEVVLWVEWMHVGTTQADEHATFLSLEASHFGNLLRNNTVWAAFVRDYGRLFHARVVAARPPAEDWPNDLAVPGASYGEILVSMPEEARRLSGEIGLYELQADHASSLHGRDVIDLQDEVRSGKSTLMVTGDGQVERVVALVTVEIMQDDGLILVQVGEDKDGVATPYIPVRLPGMKLKEAMSASDCARTVVHDRLEEMAPFISIQESKRIPETRESETRGINTHYIMTKYSAKLTIHPSLLNIQSITCRRHDLGAEISSMVPGSMLDHSYTDAISAREILLMTTTDDHLYYYSWMTEREFTMFRSGSPDCKLSLQRMFDCFSNAHSTSASSMTMVQSNKSMKSNRSGKESPPRTSSKQSSMRKPSAGETTNGPRPVRWDSHRDEAPLPPLDVAGTKQSSPADEATEGDFVNREYTWSCLV